MIGEDAFCPETGAPLSEDTHYDRQGHPYRAALRDEFTAESHPVGQLTNGAVCSSKAALFNHFRRCHRRHAEADGALYRKAALGLRRLKSTADGRQQWDVHVWYALQYRLAAAGFDVEWMHTHVEPRCPGCHGHLRYTRYDDRTVRGECATNCTGDHADQLRVVRETIADLYSHAFEDSVAPEELLRFEAPA